MKSSYYSFVFLQKKPFFSLSSCPATILFFAVCVRHAFHSAGKFIYTEILLQNSLKVLFIENNLLVTAIKICTALRSIVNDVCGWLCCQKIAG